MTPVNALTVASLTPSIDAQVSKRPLLRPAIPSPYTNSSSPKVVYVSTKTPFLAAVKRVEKLLRLSEKRAVQSAGAQIKKNRRRRGPANREGEDDIDGIARIMEEKKKGGVKKGMRADLDGDEEDVVEEVAIKGTGKAIGKVTELGLWFQQRDDYAVRLATGSAGAVDDIEIHEEAKTGGIGENQAHEQGDGAEGKEVEMPDDGENNLQGVSKEADEIPETRIRYTSVLEVFVSLR